MPKYAARGTLLKVGDGVTPTEGFTTIPHVGDIDGPGGDVGEIDVTDHSTVGNYAETLGDVQDPGQVTAPVHWDPAETLHQQLQSDAGDPSQERNYEIVYPDGSKESFAAYVQSFRTQAPVRGALTKQLTLRVAGAITFTAAA